MRKWLIGLGLVLAIVLIICLIQENSANNVALLSSSTDDFEVSFLGCSPTKIELKNKNNYRLDLGNWNIVYGPHYFFIPAKTIVEPGDSIIVWSGTGKNDAHNLYTGFSEGDFRLGVQSYIESSVVWMPSCYSKWR